MRRAGELVHGTAISYQAACVTRKEDSDNENFLQRDHCRYLHHNHKKFFKQDHLVFKTRSYANGNEIAAGRKVF